ncbi:MAG: hypothetical protein VYD71_01370 [Bacteroidota bacterium]|nr:hypothetical protein [Bacteroidota bacterium]
MKISHFFPFCISFVLAACGGLSSNDKLLVTLYDKELYYSEISSSLPNDKADSVAFVQSYIDSWIKKQLLVAQAEMNLTDVLKDVEDRIDDYRNSLLIYTYQQELVKQNFDTVISKVEIQAYYDENLAEMELKENIFKGRYVKTSIDAPKLDVLRKIFRSTKEEDSEELIEYCRQFASDYHLEESKWVYFSKFVDKLPVIVSNQPYYLSTNKYYTYTTDSNKYFLFIKQYQIKGSVSPLILVQERIRKIILNKNKLLFLKDLEDDLYQNAITNNKIKIHNE